MLTPAAVQWQMPRANDGEKRGNVSLRKNADLVGQAQHWPTPWQSDHKGSGENVYRPDGKSRMDQLAYAAEQGFHCLPPDPQPKNGEQCSSSRPGSGQRLNPAFVCWLMGWPYWWTNTALTNSVKQATAWWRYRLQQHLLSFFGVPDSMQFYASGHDPATDSGSCPQRRAPDMTAGTCVLCGHPLNDHAEMAIDEAEEREHGRQ